MLLEKLIKNLPKDKKKINIRGLAVDSRKVKKGFIFFAIRGNKLNGEKYINKAIQNGAVVVVCSKNYKKFHKNVFIVNSLDIRSLLSKICTKFYTLKPKNIIAVTGTNGKTSVADLFFQILKFNNIPVASIGTLGVKYKNKIIKSDLTSPDTIFLHRVLEKLKKQNIDNVIIEASSHGLHQKRLDNLNLKAGIFTNFSQDHLDYHKNIRAYFNAKMLLFKKVLTKKSKIILNKSLNEFSSLKKIIKNRQLQLVDTSLIQKKLKEKIDLKFNTIQLKNLSMAIAAARICNVSDIKILKSLRKIKDVNGRLELVRIFPNNIKVFVDFAHTPDALEKTLSVLQEDKKQNISLVFGCGGERDYKKRPIMAKIASKHCKKIYVTDDNPRNENPKKIRNDILKNLDNHNSFDIGNRALAIRRAILNSDPNEIVLIAGKGHENKQIYKNKIIKTSDKQIVKKIKIKIKKLSETDRTYLQNKKILKSLNIRKNLQNFHGLAIDSRVVKKNNLFLTLKGKNNDGNKFIPKALKRGAKYIISSKKIKKYKNKIINVKNEIKFLSQYANEKRKNTQTNIIAITGSAGKTSLKNLIKNLLQKFGATHFSPKSYNNHLGVPLSLSHLSTKHKYGVFEIGMSKAGEIFKLSKIVSPHIGIITNIGEAHIENFKNLKGIANSKGEIIENIQKNGTLILNRDDKYYFHLEKLAKIKKIRIVSFGLSKKSDIYPTSIKRTTMVTKLKVRIKNEIFKIEFKNINLYNVLASLAVLEVLNLNIKKILNHYKKYEAIEGRGKIYNVKRYKKNFKLIDESYNANPLSVKNAIKNFNLIKKKNFKKYLLLGDMLELGKKSQSLHKNLSKVINNSDIDKVFIKGKKTLETYKNINIKKRGNILHHQDDMDFTLNHIIANNDYLMIKGSNSTGLHQLSKRIIKGF